MTSSAAAAEAAVDGQSGQWAPEPGLEASVAKLAAALGQEASAILLQSLGLDQQVQDTQKPLGSAPAHNQTPH